MRVHLLRLLIIGMLGMVFSPANSVDAQTPIPERPVVFQENFTTTPLDTTRWHVFRQHDFHESTIDIVNGRLRMRADTTGTDEHTVKYHGIRTVAPVVNLQHSAGIMFDLNWNRQENGTYMSAGIFICPTVVDGNPEDEPNWVKVMYIGNDGNNGRLESPHQWRPI